MIVGHITGRVALGLPLTLALLLMVSGARADTAAANTCATKLAKDARTIFNSTQPEVTPGSDIRSLVTASARKLAMSGSIDRGGARQSATAAAECLKLVGA